MAKKQTTAENNLENVEHALGRSEQFIEENQKSITIFILALIILVGGYWAYKKLYLEPLEAEAQAQVFHAQSYFNNDEFQIAIDGDGMNPGFLEIIDNYGSTSAGRVSRYYAGISYLHLAEFEEAINYLKKFKTKNAELKAISTGAIGDAYLELGESAEALKWYTNASKVKNEMTTPFYLMKKGIVLEQMGDNSKALEAYKAIKEEYPNSSEARQIDKYITRVSL
jgi:tetratricopeptide (TPR) repeat protein